MKKVSMLVLLAIVATTLLMAAIPTAVVRLTMINKSGGDVYMKLEGSALTGQFYYLTVPAGTREEPVVKVFTIMSDLYQRTTWECGVQNSGTLLVDGNIRLTFVPCGQMACKWSMTTWQWWGCEKTLTEVTTAHRYAGEPRMEKVVYFKYLAVYNSKWWDTNPWVAGSFRWNNAYLQTGWWNFGCGLWSYRIRSYQLPYGCAWRYQY